MLAVSVLTLALFLQCVYGRWVARGLFESIGLDYAIFSAAARVVTDLGWARLYDATALTERFVQLLPFYDPMAPPAVLVASPNAAPFVLPFLVTNLLGPIGGFAAWTVLNLALVLAITRGLRRGPEYQGPVWHLMPFVFLPVLYNFYLGQLAILMTFGWYKASIAFRDGQEFRAGLWLGLLLLKPHFILVPALVLLGKGRWRALGGLFLAGLVLLVSTCALVGGEGVRSYLDLLRTFSGFRRVPSIVNPGDMINFRGILVRLLPEGCSEAQGTALVLVLSVLLVPSLVVVWRGSWDPRADRFPRQMLATLIVALLSGFHSHIYAAALLIVPLLAELARDREPASSRGPFLVLLYLPTFVILCTDNSRFAAWSLIAVMAWVYGVILAESWTGWGSDRIHRAGSAAGSGS
ncbi:MAG TPA: glycosyltransferase family 87 protein [Isosphaeraceae bacterium]|nr:glycosyltransferase family 87 protein [Isosphaeraceae bacterium]